MQDENATAPGRIRATAQVIRTIGVRQSAKMLATYWAQRLTAPLRSRP